MLKQKDVFTIYVRSDITAGEFIVDASPNHYFAWAAKDVCSKVSAIKKQLTESSMYIPRQWYADQFDKGQYEIEFDFSENTCTTMTGAPQHKVVWLNEQTELKKLERGAQRGLKPIIQKTVEAAQEIHMMAVDSRKYLEKAARKVMLTGVEDADDLLTVLTQGVDKLGS